MLNIICLNADDYLGKGVEYANILFDSVCRNLSQKSSFNFICFTNCLGDYTHGITIKPLPEKGLKGWWNKLSLFKDGLFMDGDRIIYLDLDTVITGGLDEIIKYDGDFAILRDFYRPYGLQSSVMAWRAGVCPYLWEDYLLAGKPDIYGGDQAWLERALKGYDIWQDLYENCFVSYKIHAFNMIPKGAKVVCFHGLPRPHEVNGWVPKVWKIGGGTTLELEIICNTQDEALIKNIRHALTLPYPKIQPVNEHDGHAVLIGGGTSLKHSLGEIKERQNHGQKIFSLNNTFKFLLENGITPDFHVMLDARVGNKEFIPKIPMTCYYASQCAPEIFESARGQNIIIWHSLAYGIIDIIGKDTGDALIGGGYSVGMKAIALVHTLGYRKIHLYGYDSSYDDKEHHAYKQPLNDKESTLEVEMNGKKYRAAAWMCSQVDDFKEVARLLVEGGSLLTVHGTGLLPDCAKLIAVEDTPDTEAIKIGGIWWPSKDRMCRDYHAMTFPDCTYLLEQCEKRKVAIQAGGNVGLWPREMAKFFDIVYTFEPDELNFECLMRNTEGLDNILAYPYALGDKPSRGALHRISYNCGAHYIKDGDEFPIVTIDSMPIEHCDLIQLDIEGYELNALKGAQKTIEIFRPVIMVEDKGLSKKYGSLMGDIGKWLGQFGYQMHSEAHRDIIFVAKNNYLSYNSHEINVNRKATHA